MAKLLELPGYPLQEGRSVSKDFFTSLKPVSDDVQSWICAIWSDSDLFYISWELSEISCDQRTHKINCNSTLGESESLNANTGGIIRSECFFKVFSLYVSVNSKPDHPPGQVPGEFS